MLKDWPGRIITLFLVLLTFIPLTAQEVMRLELEASDFSLPYYTMPAGDKGVVVFRGTEIKGRRIATWELIHYDPGFRVLDRKTINPEKTCTFAGWEEDDHHLVLLFVDDPPGLSGIIITYDLNQRSLTEARFSYPESDVSDMFFILSGQHIYLGGCLKSAEPRNTLLKRKKAMQKDPALLVLSGLCTGDTLLPLLAPVTGLTGIARVQTAPDSTGLIFAVRITTGKYREDIEVLRIGHGDQPPETLGRVAHQPERYLIDFTFVYAKNTLVLAGTYGLKTNKAWKREDPVLAEGLFFIPLDTLQQIPARYHPFTTFRHLPANLMKNYFQAAGGNAVSKNSKGKMAYRMLLHETPYAFNQHIVLLAEAYYPEYEYENRTQYSSMPYAYYGSFYPGFYDAGGRWVFKGFRYEHAMVAALDSVGNLVWENGFETSNILDKNLNTRITILPYTDEMVLVYAFDGRIWYRILGENSVLVDKESIPVELPSPADKIKENYSTYMAQWYKNYFLVWGRQSVRNAGGNTRTVYYCNKLSFE